MPEYVIEVPHSPGECGAAGRRMEWTSYYGCRYGTHTSWTIVVLRNEEEAWALVPGMLRDTARVVSVERSQPASAEPVIDGAASPPGRGEQHCGEEG